LKNIFFSKTLLTTIDFTIWCTLKEIITLVTSVEIRGYKPTSRMTHSRRTIFMFVYIKIKSMGVMRFLRVIL